MIMIRIALVDDHVMLRKSLAVLIQLFPDLEIVLQANNGAEFIEQLPNHPLPDIVLMDVNMPVMNGVETTRWLHKQYPQIKVMALSMLKNELVLIRMLKNGARGYLLKDAEPEELNMAIQQVQEKGFYFSELVKPGLKICTNGQSLQPDQMLNEQELIFLQWTCTEKSHKQIAAEMCVSPRTVDGYRDSLFRKLNVTSRVGMVMYALKHEIVLL
jgi:DNA-binding NarL/FixJ family response regulator